MRVPAHAALGAPRALLRAGVERVIVWLGVGVDTERLHREVHMRLRRVTAPVLPQSPHGHRPKAPMQPPYEGGWVEGGGGMQGPCAGAPRAPRAVPQQHPPPTARAGT
jgi:hypothetical protein